MKRLIAGSAALLGAIAVPAQAQSLGAIVNSVLGSGYTNGYQQPYGYQPSYGYGYQPSYGYQPAYGYQQSYRYRQTYSPSYNGYSYSPYSYRQSYGYSRSRDYQRRHEHRRSRHQRDENGD